MAGGSRTRGRSIPLANLWSWEEQVFCRHSDVRHPSKFACEFTFPKQESELCTQFQLEGFSSHLWVLRCLLLWTMSKYIWLSHWPWVWPHQCFYVMGHNGSTLIASHWKVEQDKVGGKEVCGFTKFALWGKKKSEINTSLMERLEKFHSGCLFIKYGYKIRSPNPLDHIYFIYTGSLILSQ